MNRVHSIPKEEFQARLKLSSGEVFDINGGRREERGDEKTEEKERESRLARDEHWGQKNEIKTWSNSKTMATA